MSSHIETPAEHIRNALQILQTGEIRLCGRGAQVDANAIAARLISALQLIELPAVDVDHARPLGAR